MGLLLRIALQFDGERLGLGAPTGSTYRVGNTIPAETCCFLTFPFGFDLVIGFAGGRFSSSVRMHSVKGHATGWADNPSKLDAYATAMPDHYNAHGEPARPAGDRIFFAGEAVAIP